MFNEQEYREVFSHVTASPETYRRVLGMAKQKTKPHMGRRTAILIAAMIALLTLSVTAFASEYIQNWFVSFFTERSNAELNQQQVDYIEENTQIIHDVQTCGDWSVELRSAFTDGTTGYIVFHVKGPDDVDLTDWTDDQGNIQGQIHFGNGGMPGYLSGLPEYFSLPGDVAYGSWGETWLDDGDGLGGTKYLLITLEPDKIRSAADPFGSETVYEFRFENIVWSYTDTEYEAELRSGKYAGQNGVMYTEEELKKINRWELLAEGVWEFDVTFAQTEQSGESVELLTAPVHTTAGVLRRVGEEITDYETVEESVMLISVQMRHLSVTFSYAQCSGVADFDLWDGDQVTHPQVILKDGTSLELLPCGNTGNNLVSMASKQPIVFEDVDYILMADGTIIEMPE